MVTISQPGAAVQPRKTEEGTNENLVSGAKEGRAQGNMDIAGTGYTDRDTKQLH